MNLLLDTHTFIWFVENDSRLPEKIRIEIENVLNTIYVSIASLWEITIKISLGKLEIKSNIKKIIEQITENGFEILPILPNHLIKLSKLAYHHRDPFDRIIIAQSILEKFDVISKDVIFDDYKVDRLWS